MIHRIAPLAFAAACLAAPAAAPAQPSAVPAGAPAASAPGSEPVIVLSESHRENGQGAAQAESARARRDGHARIFRVQPGGGAFEIHAENGNVYRLDRDDGGVFVVNDKDGTIYRVGRGDNGVVVLHARDGRTYRVNDESRRVFVLRAKDGGAYRVDGAPVAFRLRRGDGPAYRLSALESCGGAQPLIDRSSDDGHDRTKVIICGDHAGNPADRVTQLEHMLARMQTMDGLSDSSRERVTAALREAIEEARDAH